MYDGLLDMKLSSGAKLIGCAADIALIVQQASIPLIEIVGDNTI